MFHVYTYWLGMSSSITRDHSSFVCVVHPSTGNRDALRKRAHYRSSRRVTISFTKSAPSRSRAFTFSRVPSKSLVSLGFLYSSPFSPPLLPSLLILVPVALAEDDSASCDALAGDCYVRKKPRRGQKAWII